MNDFNEIENNAVEPKIILNITLKSSLLNKNFIIRILSRNTKLENITHSLT